VQRPQQVKSQRASCRWRQPDLSLSRSPPASHSGPRSPAPSHWSRGPGRVSRPAPKPAAGLCRRQPTLLRRHQAPGDRARDHRVEATGRFAARQRCIGQAVPLNTNVTTRFRTTLAGSWTAPACASQTTPPTSRAAAIVSVKSTRWLARRTQRGSQPGYADRTPVLLFIWKVLLEFPDHGPQQSISSQARGTLQLSDTGSKRRLVKSRGQFAVLVATGGGTPRGRNCRPGWCLVANRARLQSRRIFRL
jgi:hypothetical protein